MSTRDFHEELIGEVARALGELNNKAVYVGGAVVSLYVNDPAARDVRPTDDVDITLKITSSGNLERLRQKLVDKGFSQSPEDDVTCRFRYQDIKVDVMSTREIGWAPANPWFKPGFDHLQKINVNNIPIQILSLPYFLASKITAFRGRANDPRTSHDLEDITYILDNRIDFAKEVIKAPDDVLAYLVDQFEEIVIDPAIKEAMLGNLEYPERLSFIEEKLRQVINTQ